ncbi:MAG: cytochrome D1 domain-containing protein [Burkholderiaceae bacterium]|nr:cytochrome D1 domain-containing protein [Burkholderiaceae bacterium]
MRHRRGWLSLSVGMLLLPAVALTAVAADAQAPRWRGDPMNLVVVVEAGDDHVSLVDGERFERIHRFASRPALRGEPKFSPDGRFAYFASLDGWITRYDLWTQAVAAEVRAGTVLQDIAISSDGLWLLVGNQMPQTVVLFDAGLNTVKRWAAATRDGKAGSRVAAVADAPARQAFVVALQDIAELWLISYDPKAEDIYEGLVHDFRMGEGLPIRGFHNVKRSLLAEPLHDLGFDVGDIHAIGNARARDGAAVQAQVVNLDVRRRVATLPSTGTPQPGAAISLVWNGANVLAMRNREDGAIDVIDMKSWRHIKTIATAGPGSFLRSHPGSRHAWADATSAGRVNDTLTLIDKTTLEAVAQIRQAGHPLSHVEFSRNGRHALVSQAGAGGALLVYDTATLKEIKRLPMNRPVGAYNVGNRVARPPGAPR